MAALVDRDVHDVDSSVVVLVFLLLVFYCYLILDDHKTAKGRTNHPKKIGRHGVPKLNVRLRNPGPVDEPTEESVKLRYASKKNMMDQANSLRKVDQKKDQKSFQDRDLPQDTSVPVPVLLTADHERIGGLITTINSIRLNTQHPVHFYLLVDEESLEHVRAWIDGSQLKGITYKIKIFDEKLISLHEVHGARHDLESPLNFARFFALDYFPELTSRIVYVDTDTVVQGDIWALFSTPIQQGHYGAFSDDCSSVSKRFSMHLNYYASYLNFKSDFIKNLQFNPKECTFDIGVYVADMEQWKKDNVSSQLKYWVNLNKEELVFGHGKGVGPVKPPMLIVFYKKFTRLNPLWNVRNLGQTTGNLYSDSFVRSAKALHWNGVYKPWKRVSQFQDIWDQYYVPDPTEKFVVVRKDGEM